MGPNRATTAANPRREIALRRVLPLSSFKATFFGLSLCVAIAHGQSRYIGDNYSFTYPEHLQQRQNTPNSISILPPGADPSATLEGTTIRVFRAPQECYQFHETMHDSVVGNFIQNVPSAREVKKQYDERIGSRSETLGVYTSSLVNSAVDSGPAPNSYIASFCDHKEELLVLVFYSKHPTSFNTAQMIIDSWKFGTARSAQVPPPAGAGFQSAPAPTETLCQSGAAPGTSWFGEMWMRGGSNANVSLIFGPNQTFKYSLARGARTVLAVSGKFSMQRSSERADRWPSACRITFQPTEVTVRPRSDELDVIKERGLFDGSTQTYRIDRSYGTGETMILLNATIDDPTSTSDMYFQRR
jgi:hypothetical protein